MNVVSFQYSYGFCVGDRTVKTSISRLAIGFSDNKVILATSSNEHVDGKQIPMRTVFG